MPWMLRRDLVCAALAALTLGSVAVLTARTPLDAARSEAELPGQTLILDHFEHGSNSASAQKAHYVVLVSLDGFRWDYAQRDHALNLLSLGKHGAWAPEGMYPSYPSLTFPNHWTMVTGLYPGNHGIVANNFYDPVRPARYSNADPQAVRDGSWYRGIPLWSLAESQGMRTACLFWPGSEAKVAGFEPTWLARFDGKTEATEAVEQGRIDDTLALLKLPSAKRPHFIAIYSSEPDHEGHQFGPDAPETKAAVAKMDRLVGKLKSALDSTGLPIDLVVVSDHGMTKTEGGWITLDQFADLNGFESAGALLYGKSEADRERVYNQLKKASSQFVVYRLKDLPASWNLKQNARAGDPVVVATGAYAIRAHAPPPEKRDQPPPAGMHGLDARRWPEMKAVFIAAGPDIVPGKTVAPFDNVNLYPWLAHLLALQAPAADGSLNVLAGTLRDNGVDAKTEGVSEQ